MNAVNETHSYLWQSVLPIFIRFRWIIWWDEVIRPIWYLRGMLRRGGPVWPPAKPSPGGRWPEGPDEGNVYSLEAEKGD